MCTAVLQKELTHSVAGLPDSSVRLLIEIAKSMKPATCADVSDGVRNAASGVDKRIVGIFPGEVTIADDFFETPDCFKEYV